MSLAISLISCYIAGDDKRVLLEDYSRVTRGTKNASWMLPRPIPCHGLGVNREEVAPSGKSQAAGMCMVQTCPANRTKQWRPGCLGVEDVRAFLVEATAFLRRPQRCTLDVRGGGDIQKMAAQEG